MSNEELLIQAESFSLSMLDEDNPEWVSAKALEIIAFSQLVIARNSEHPKANQIPVDLKPYDVSFNAKTSDK